MAAAEKSSVVTLGDVAKRAGVSTVTVSAVVNGARTSARVSPATRERVLQAARELRYAPNAAARSLRRPGMRMIGVAVNRAGLTFIDNPYVSHLLEGILDAATAADFAVALFPRPWESAERSAAPFRDRRTDGLIVLAPALDSDMVRELAAMELPLVLVSAPADAWGPETPPVPAVCVDDEGGARLAARHLLALGHGGRIGFVAGGNEHRVASARARRAGFLGALAASGCPARDAYVVPGHYNFEGGRAAAGALLDLPEPPTAIFAANDHSALGALRAARERGVAVPGRLSVVGFDDIPEAFAPADGGPPLTTVRSPLVAMGRQAAELLVARVAGQPVAPVTYRHEPELVVRGSTRPPRGEGTAESP